MKKLGALLAVLSFVVLLVAGIASAQGEAKKGFKTGETVYVCSCGAACACGEGCNCGTISQKPGKCGCGKDMKKL
jgi:hypothetical protein